MSEIENLKAAAQAAVSAEPIRVEPDRLGQIIAKAIHQHLRERAAEQGIPAEVGDLAKIDFEAVMQGIAVGAGTMLIGMMSEVESAQQRLVAAAHFRNILTAALAGAMAYQPKKEKPGAKD